MEYLKPNIVVYPLGLWSTVEGNSARNHFFFFFFSPNKGGILYHPVVFRKGRKERQHCYLHIHTTTTNILGHVLA